MSDKEFVYVVTETMLYEGTSVVLVARSLKRAKAYIKEVQTSDGKDPKWGRGDATTWNSELYNKNNGLFDTFILQIDKMEVAKDGISSAGS